MIAGAAACERGPRAASDEGSWIAAAVTDIRTVPIRVKKGLREMSAAAMSAKQPGVVFTINDSGNEPRLYAVDTTGALRGEWWVARTPNVDWETTSIGPCDLSPARDCVYIGDVGDNKETLPSHTIYRVPEPVAAGGRDTVVPEALRFTYARGAWDVEAMYVARNGDIFLITKRPHRRPGGGLRPAYVFALPASAWKTKAVATADLVDSLPIVPGSALLRLITDAGLSPDGRHLAVRTYTEAYIFATDSVTGRIDHDTPPSVCDLVPLGEGQGEGLTWSDAAGRLVFTSEGATPQLRLGTCPLPKRDSR